MFETGSELIQIQVQTGANCPPFLGRGSGLHLGKAQNRGAGCDGIRTGFSRLKWDQYGLYVQYRLESDQFGLYVAVQAPALQPPDSGKVALKTRAA